MKKILLVLVTICSCLTLVSCVTFPQNDLPKYSYDELLHNEQKQPIDYDIKTLAWDSLINEETQKATLDLLDREVVKAFGDSGSFARFSKSTGTERIHISLVYNHGQYFSPLSVLNIFSGISVGMIPSLAANRTLYPRM